MEMFLTRSALVEGGLSLLAVKHNHATLVATREQLEYLRERSGATNVEFYKQIEQIKETAGLCVVEEPKGTPEDLSPDVRQKLANIIDRRLRNWNPLTQKQVRQELIEFYERDLITLKVLARQRNVNPQALVNSDSLAIVGAAGMGIVKLRSYKKGNWPFVAPRWTKIVPVEYWDAFSAEPEIGMLLVILIFSIGFMIILILQPALTSALNFLVNSALELPNKILAIIFSLLGVALYCWRSRALFSYGLAEVIVGVTGITAKVPSLSERESLSAWVTVVLAVYIVVRGLDNVGKSLGKARTPSGLLDGWTKLFGNDSVR